MASMSIAGSGGITPIHALAASTLGMDVLAIASRDSANALRRSHDLHTRAVPYSGLPAGADIVVVATPPAQHLEHAIHALRSGACCVVEKPLAATLADADRFVAEAAQHPGRIAYAENLAYSPIVQQMLRRRASLGPLTHIECRSFAPDIMQSRRSDTWGGGVLFDIGTQAVALAVLLAHPAIVVSVSASIRASDQTGVDDDASVALDFDTGLRATVIANRGSTASALLDAQVAGDHGVLRAELLPTCSLEYNGGALPITRSRLELPEVEDLGFLGEHRAFRADFAAGREPVMDTSFGRLVLDIVCAAYASAAAGKPMAVPFAGDRHRTPMHLWRGG